MAGVEPATLKLEIGNVRGKMSSGFQPLQPTILSFDLKKDIDVVRVWGMREGVGNRFKT